MRYFVAGTHQEGVFTWWGNLCLPVSGHQGPFVSKFHNAVQLFFSVVGPGYAFFTKVIKLFCATATGTFRVFPSLQDL